jgi:hypothetical protein
MVMRLRTLPQIKHANDPFSMKGFPLELITITADDKDKLFAIYFREYVNRSKYVNSVNFSWEDPAMRAEYSK